LPDPDDYSALADSMEMLLTDDSLRTRLITRGFERAAEFSWEKSARTVLDVYEKLTGITGE
jgi:glycosyltransferase involved in cell wall biosynthesis